MARARGLWACALLFVTAFFSLGVLAQEAAPKETPGPRTESAEKASMLSDSGLLRLVNREKLITMAYEPGDLVVPKVATRKKGMEQKIRLRAEAARALEKMFTAAKREKGYVLFAVSGYRSYGIQQLLFSSKVEEAGSKQAAQRSVAPPGTSEHQLGLAMDIQAPSQLNLNRQFGDTQEGKWAAENAHRFGFILRYKQEWSKITGYRYEPWHFRYVGLAHARAIHMLDIPYEEYVAAIEKLPEYVLSGASDYLLAGLVRGMAADPYAEPEASLLSAAEDQQAEALRAATMPYLPEGQSYEEVLWAVYPTPRPTAGPRVDTDEDFVLFSSESSHGLPPQ